MPGMIQHQTFDKLLVTLYKAKQGRTRSIKVTSPQARKPCPKIRQAHFSQKKKNPKECSGSYLQFKGGCFSVFDLFDLVSLSTSSQGQTRHKLFVKRLMDDVRAGIR